MYNTYKEQNEEIKHTLNLIKSSKVDLQKAYTEYSKKAKKVNLDPAIKKKVEEGSIEITNYDKETQDKIAQYLDYLNKAKDAKNQLNEAEKTEKDLILKEYDNIKDDFDRRVDYQQSILSILEKDIDYRKSLGQIISASDYNVVLAQQNVIKKTIENEIDLLQSQLDSMVKSKEIAIGDDEWYDMIGNISSLKSNLKDVDVSIQNINKDIASLSFEKFEKALSTIENVRKEFESVAKLLNSDNFVDKEGNITTEGLSAISLYQRQIYVYEAEMQSYSEALDDLKKKLNAGTISQDEFNSRLDQYKTSQLDLASSIKSLTNDITSIKVSSLEAITNAVKEENDATIKEIELQEELRKKQKETAKDNDAIAKMIARRDKLRLSESQKDQYLANELDSKIRELQEDRNEKILEDTAQAKIDKLNETSDAVENANNDEIDEIKRSTSKQQQIVSDMLDNVQGNYSHVMNNITNIVYNAGIDLTENLTSPWRNGIDAVNEYKETIESIADFGADIKAVDTSKSLDDSVLKILKNGNAKSNEASTSDLNKAVKSYYGNALSYSQMSSISKLLGLNYSSEDMKNNSNYKDIILTLLKQLGYLGGNKDIASSSIPNNRNSVLASLGNTFSNKSLKSTSLVGGTVPLLSSVASSNNLKYTIPTVGNIANSTKLGTASIGATLNIDKLVNIEGSADEKTINLAIQKSKEEVIPIVNDYVRNQINIH